jgi:thymidylate kinase
MILLDAPAELMYARKGEHGVAELQLRRKAYLAMAERFPQMVVIDAEQSRDAVRRQATELIWKRWSQSDGSGASRSGSRAA